MGDLGGAGPSLSPAHWRTLKKSPPQSKGGRGEIHIMGLKDAAFKPDFLLLLFFPVHSYLNFAKCQGHNVMHKTSSQTQGIKRKHLEKGSVQLLRSVALPGLSAGNQLLIKLSGRNQPPAPP